MKRCLVCDKPYTTTKHFCPCGGELMTGRYVPKELKHPLDCEGCFLCDDELFEDCPQL